MIGQTKTGNLGAVLIGKTGSVSSVLRATFGSLCASQTFINNICHKTSATVTRTNIVAITKPIIKIRLQLATYIGGEHMLPMVNPFINISG